MTEKLDDASWHYGGNYPADLPPEAGSTHIGMFFVWMIQRGLADGKTGMFAPKEIELVVTAKSATPGTIFRRACDEKLLDDDFTYEGAVFARRYYAKMYFDDYDAAVGTGAPTLYHVADSWKTFDRLKPALDKRYDEWARGILKLNEDKS